MNTAVSLDVEIFQMAEKEAEFLQVSVPELCSLAIKDFLQNKHTNPITEKVNAIYSTYRAKIDDDILQAQYDGLEEEDW